MLISRPRANLASLARAIEVIEARTGWDRSTETDAPNRFTPDPAWDRPDHGAIHEVFSSDHAPRSWCPPLGILIHMASRVIEDRSGTSVLWIGRCCWPYPHTLIPRTQQAHSLLDCSIFIDPRNDSERVWAIDLALRCPGVGAVVADGSRLKMPHSRRLQLAAAWGKTTGLLARPLYERGELSVARSRLLVAAAVSPNSRPRWRIDMLRHPIRTGGKVVFGGWVVEQDDETGFVHLVADDVDRSAAPSGSAADAQHRRSA